MRCSYCGARLAEDELRCPVCGTDVQIVPDYNPLEDVLTDQVKGSLNRAYDREAGTRPNSTRQGSGRQNQNGTRQHNVHQNTGRQYVERERVRQETGRTDIDERARRRRQAERKRMLAKKKKQKKMMITAVVALVLIIAGVICYQNSYTGQVKKGYKLIESAEYDEAIICFQNAIEKNAKKSEAYKGIAEVYIVQNDLEKAEQVFLQVIEEQPDNLAIYIATVEFYVETNQESKIAYLLKETINSTIAGSLEAYISDVPEFSLDEEEIYDDVQALELTSNGKAIYYTLDGSIPTTSSTKYKEPIKLEEGVTEVKAISVNDAGIPSVIVSKTFTIEFPMADAPSVTPSTGQYTEAQTISIVVEDNYEAYYTLDGTAPKPGEGSTKKYTGSIDMPEGNTIFKAVLVDQKGRVSDVTTRNYELLIEETEEE